MHAPYVQSTSKHVPDGSEKIVFDKFHVSKSLNEAVDKVRREEHKQLMASGDDSLKGTKYGWLRNPTKETADQRAAMRALRSSNLRTARASGVVWVVKAWRRRPNAWPRPAIRR